MSDPKICINLKSVRQKAGLSLSQTAELTGISKAMLHQIERGTSNPTIATLWKLAKGFHLPLTAFIEDIEQTEDPGPHIAPPPLHFPESISVHPLFPFDPLLGSETFLVTLAPGLSHISVPHDIGVVEDIFVTEGSIDILREDKWQRYDKGDAIRFRADQAHGYRNSGDQLAQFHNVLHYPRTSLLGKRNKPE